MRVHLHRDATATRAPKHFRGPSAERLTHHTDRDFRQAELTPDARCVRLHLADALQAGTRLDTTATAVGVRRTLISDDSPRASSPEQWFTRATDVVGSPLKGFDRGAAQRRGQKFDACAVRNLARHP